jgi:hypothetical protein
MAGNDRPLLQKPLLVYNKVLTDFKINKTKMSWFQVQGSAQPLA